MTIRYKGRKQMAAKTNKKAKKAEPQYEVYPVRISPAACAVDLGDGSERGEYVDQDYILHTIGRPLRSISLMYCYYPNDEGWPLRSSVAFKDKEVGFAWDYPYDDYFTYKGGLNGNREDEPFNYMREIRRHGQDITLTITMDPHLSDEHLIAIAKDLKTFGRVFLRVNHEATGTWFEFTKRATQKEIGDFFAHFTEILKKEAPNVTTILCTGGVDEKNSKKIEKGDDMAEGIKAADIMSIDKYFALHYGWPYDVAERGGKSHLRYNIKDVMNYTKKSYELFKNMRGGKPTPMMMSELNSDGDVTGPYDQVNQVKEFLDMIKKEKMTWFSGFSFYQFRDRGRLGLEIEDPNNPNVGIKQPIMDYFKKMVHDPYFSPKIRKSSTKEVQFPVQLRWGNSEDADGLAVKLHLEKNPHFCELYFEEDLNLMIELNGTWFYKAPGTKVVDLMEAFFNKPIKSAKDLTLKFFAPPATGENDLSAEDGINNVYTTMNALPKIRIEYEPVEIKAT